MYTFESFFISGGHIIPESCRNTTYNGMVHQTDWYSSFAELGGVSQNDIWNNSGPIAPDSVHGILQAILKNTSSPRRELVYNIFGSNPGAIRMGKYKLIVGDPNLKQAYNGYNGWNGTDIVTKNICTHIPCLFDLSTDPYEYHDIAQENEMVLSIHFLSLLKRKPQRKGLH